MADREMTPAATLAAGGGGAAWAGVRGLVSGGVAVLSVIAYLGLCAWVWPFTMDDAFISFRYARHIGDGLGPIWNLADRARPVEGFTSFLHVWLLGGIRFVTGADLVPLGKALGVLAILALTGCVAREVRRAGLGGVAAAVALSFLLLPFTALNSVSGMETPLFMLWNWLCAMTCVRLVEAPAARMVWVFVLFGLLGTLTRPEFAAPFVLMAGYVWWRCPALRPGLLRAIVVLFVLPGLAVTAWRYGYYGDLVPNPFYVKQAKGLSKGGAIYVARFLGFVALPYLILALAGWRSLWTFHRNLVMVVALNVAVACAYFTTTNPTMGWWYRFLLPQIPLLAFCGAVAFTGAHVRERGRPFVLRVAGVALLALLSVAHVPVIERFLAFHEAHEARYREVGRRLRPFAAPDRWLNYYDVGSIVYESEWNTVDIVGLNTHRKRRGSPCELRTDVVLRFSFGQRDIPNPCPGLYVASADLPFSKQVPLTVSYMRVFVRNDVTYADELRKSIVEDWPEPFIRPADWIAEYSRRYRSVFLQ